MPTTVLGRIVIVPKGAYSAATEYQKLDLVTDSGSSYLYINATPATGVALTDVAYWTVIASKGAEVESVAADGDDLVFTRDDATTLTIVDGLKAVNDATALANTKAGLADTATGLANTATSGANDARDAALAAKASTEAATLIALATPNANGNWSKDSKNPLQYFPAPSAPLYYRREGVFSQAGSGDPSPTNIRPIAPFMASGAEVKLANSGKNLFDKANNVISSAYLHTVNNIVTAASGMTTIYVPCQPSTTYTFRKTAGTRFIVAETSTATVPAVGTAIQGAIINQTASSITITTSTNAKYILAFVWNSATDTTITAQAMIDSVQIELGSVPTAYEPYSGSTATLTAPAEIASGWIDNKGAGEATWARYVYTGVETVVSYSTQSPNYFCFYISRSGKSLADNLSRCSHLPNIASVWTLRNVEAVSDNPSYARHYYVLANSRLGIVDGDSDATKISAVQAWLAGQSTAGTPVTIAYQLATPTALTPVSASLNSIPALDLATERLNVFTSSLSGILTYPKSKVRTDRILRNSQLWRKSSAGNPVSIYPAPETPMNVKVTGTYTQDGTGDPSPSNIRALSPWRLKDEVVPVKRTGKNLFDKKTMLQAATINETTGEINFTASPLYVAYIPCKPNTQYTIRKIVTSRFSIACYPAPLSSGLIGTVLLVNNAASTLTVTTDSTAQYLAVYVTTSAESAILQTVFDSIQFELGSVATPYEPYIGDEVSLIAPQEIAAGWMDNEGQGQGTSLKYIFTGLESWYETPGTTGDKYYEFQLTNKLSIVACSHYSLINISTTTVIGGIDPRSTIGTYVRVRPDLVAIPDLATWKAFLAAQLLAGTPVTVVYQPVTPVALAPTIAPLIAIPQLDRITPRQNVLTATPAASAEVTYIKSPIRESDELTAAIAAL